MYREGSEGAIKVGGRPAASLAGDGGTAAHTAVGTAASPLATCMCLSGVREALRYRPTATTFSEMVSALSRFEPINVRHPGVERHVFKQLCRSFANKIERATIVTFKSY